MIKLKDNVNSLTLGATPVKAVEEVYMGDSAPAEDKGYKIWISEGEAPDEVITRDELEKAVEEAIKGADIDLEGYATEEYVNSAIDAIELKEGPQGPKGDMGPAPVKGVDYFDGKDGVDGKTPVKGVDYWTEADKTGIVSDVLAALPAAEGVRV